MKPQLLIFVFLILSNITFAQKMKHGIEYQYNVNTVLAAPEIVYYGWDFSSFKMYDANKIGIAKEIIDKYIPTWIGMLNERFPPQNVAIHYKKNVTPNMVSVQGLYKNMTPDDLISFISYEFPIDTVKKIVESYNLPERSGIGMTIILESFNKPERYVTGYVTFFDIQNREVLWSTKMKGLPGSKWGFTQYLFEGFVELYGYYLNDYYYKQLNK